MTRFAWLTLALISLPAGCTLLADSALPDDAQTGGGGSGATGGSSPSTGGAGTGTSTGSEGGGGAGSEICFNGIDDDDDGDADCADPSCGGTCQPWPTGAVAAVMPTGTTCPFGFQELGLSDCSECACTPIDSGTCVWQYDFYETSDCSGSPAQSGTSISLDCLDLPTPASAAVSQTVGVETTVVGAGDATCDAPNATAPPTARTLCVAGEATGCMGALVCAPPSATPVCMLLDGDVACPASHPTAELLFDTGASSCNCQCGGGEQSCPAGLDLHTHPDGACGGGKVDVFNQPGCQDTGWTTVTSVEQHTDTLTALSSGCSNESAPSGGGTAMTLCCP